MARERKGPRGWNLKGPGKSVLRGKDNPGWRGDAASDETKRQRCRRRYAIGLCDSCGLPASDRHHKDGNTGNNDPGNIAILCRTCHMQADGRLEGFLSHCKGLHPTTAEPKSCLNCGRPSKPLRRGRCHSCNEYLRRNGVERPYSEDGRKEKAVTVHAYNCPGCGRSVDVVGKPIAGMCRSCYRRRYPRKG